MSRIAVARQNVESERAQSADDLWAAYGATGSVEARDRLVLHYAGLVTYIAGRVGANLPSSVDYSDLIQSGVLGLMDAVARFDPERGPKFETFAVTRIRGAMIDEMRTLDWVPRSVRRKARELEAATEECHRLFNRAPSSQDLSVALEVSIDEVHRIRAQVGGTRVASLDEMLSSHVGENVSLAETISDPFAQLPGDSIDEELVQDALRASLAALTERDRSVLVYSFIDGLTLAQIGGILGVTESRVCQMRSAALKKVRAELKGRLTG